MSAKPVRLASVSFDAYPNHKGAATHIHHVAQALPELGDLDLVTLPGTHGLDLPPIVGVSIQKYLPEAVISSNE